MRAKEWIADKQAKAEDPVVKEHFQNLDSLYEKRYIK